VCEPRVENNCGPSHRVGPISLTRSYLDSFLVIREETTGLNCHPAGLERGSRAGREHPSYIQLSGEHGITRDGQTPLDILQLNTHTHAQACQQTAPSSHREAGQSLQRAGRNGHSKGFFSLRLILKDTSLERDLTSSARVCGSAETTEKQRDREREREYNRAKVGRPAREGWGRTEMH